MGSPFPPNTISITTADVVTYLPSSLVEYYYYTYLPYLQLHTSREMIIYNYSIRHGITALITQKPPDKM